MPESASTIGRSSWRRAFRSPGQLGAPSKSSRKNCKPEKCLALAGCSNSTSTSTSLSARADPRAEDPNNLSRRTPKRSCISGPCSRMGLINSCVLVVMAKARLQNHYLFVAEQFTKHSSVHLQVPPISSFVVFASSIMAVTSTAIAGALTSYGAPDRSSAHGPVVCRSIMGNGIEKERLRLVVRLAC
jgi:hypothetical protein